MAANAPWSFSALAGVVAAQAVRPRRWARKVGGAGEGGEPWGRGGTARASSMRRRRPTPSTDAAAGARERTQAGVVVVHSPARTWATGSGYPAVRKIP